MSLLDISISRVKEIRQRYSTKKFHELFLWTNILKVFFAAIIPITTKNISMSDIGITAEEYRSWTAWVQSPA
jgi:hypothetical protein